MIELEADMNQLVPHVVDRRKLRQRLINSKVQSFAIRFLNGSESCYQGRYAHIGEQRAADGWRDAALVRDRSFERRLGVRVVENELAKSSVKRLIHEDSKERGFRASDAIQRSVEARMVFAPTAEGEAEASAGRKAPEVVAYCNGVMSPSIRCA